MIRDWITLAGGLIVLALMVSFLVLDSLQARAMRRAELQRDAWKAKFDVLEAALGRAHAELACGGPKAVELVKREIRKARWRVVRLEEEEGKHV